MDENELRKWKIDFRIPFRFSDGILPALSHADTFLKLRSQFLLSSYEHPIGGRFMFGKEEGDRGSSPGPFERRVLVLPTNDRNESERKYGGGQFRCLELLLTCTLQNILRQERESLKSTGLPSTLIR